MASRRNFLKTVGAAGAGLTAASMAGAAHAADNARAAYNGPHKMPTGMKLLMMKNADGSESLGVVTDKGVIDVRAAAAKYHIAAPMTLDELLQGGNADGLNAVVDKARSSGDALLDETKIQHAKMFAHPSKIMCVGLNYRQHAKEVGMKEPSVPVLFNKYDNTLTGHNSTIKLPAKDIATKFDYETELLIVIGKQARNVSESEALSYVAGYCTSNDFSARDLQLELPSGQWMIGKTLDDFAPIGPYFVSSDLVGNPNNLKIQTRVNGELRQSSNTNDFIFNTQQMVSYISRFWTLNPGDIIFTGTPQGVIAGYPKEKQVWLKPGDEIVSSIEKLGELRFKLA
ncbi:fumarylacetoacetate hydrolase family protein [Noviherbaspirillum pedocola]|uniref:Fumarylacetoacetate hydrolase family protein n=1 Tax=Noviherbaspirillum pedocola TaxID=2801341 RepID=A0A934W463_9BURK|nr:fumarylacetoacetate hydrolase family protein [Noviherbaspirillum pedocola]MBK4738176.1 fumarylacetoacetate hydrolase family protein [Noviherbaspirillum pedocola]